MVLKVISPNTENKIDKIYHMTNMKNWKEIRKSGYLFPNTPNPLKSDKEIYCVVGLERPYDERWEKYGLLDELIEYTEDGVLLEIPVFSDGFVRDYYMFSPAKLKKIALSNFSLRYELDYFYKENPNIFLNDIDTLNNLINGTLNPKIPSFSGYIKDYEAFFKYTKRFFESISPLSSYDGSFKAPEIWLPQKTPISKIRLIHRSKSYREALITYKNGMKTPINYEKFLQLEDLLNKAHDLFKKEIRRKYEEANSNGDNFFIGKRVAMPRNHDNSIVVKDHLDIESVRDEII